MLIQGLQLLTALPQQSLATLASHLPPVGVHHLLFPALSAPPLSPAFRFCAVRSYSRFG
jgi:hypothetical protein